MIEISHKNLKVGALIKIINPRNKNTLVLKNTKRIQYPDFYKILITDAVARELDLNKNLPILEIIEIKKNKSFIAKKAKLLMKKKKFHQKLQLHQFKYRIFQKKNKKTRKKSDKIYIHIGTFYSIGTAKFLKESSKGSTT